MFYPTAERLSSAEKNRGAGIGEMTGDGVGTEKGKGIKQEEAQAKKERLRR